MVEGTVDRRREPAREGAKKRLRSKSTRRAVTLSPFQERLKETDCYTRPHLESIAACPTVKERLLLVNSLLSDDVTDISRVWPMQLRNKDSRVRRELSEKGREHFVKGEHEQVLQCYNRALLFSSGKGIAHTLARRAAFFLSTGEPLLALRDLSTALEYGCQQTELLDFLLAHHTPATQAAAHGGGGRSHPWAAQVTNYLDSAARLRENGGNSSGGQTAMKQAHEEILKNIVKSIQSAATEMDIEANLETKELEVPEVAERNPLCPAFTEAVAVCYHDDKGRMIKARRDIKAGELICVDTPIVSLLCPDRQETVFAHCVDCFRATKAPLPCDNCCTVVFCSKECKKRALNTYHKYECQMRLYEMYQHEGRDVFGLFMALRSITQKPLSYFTENQKEIEKFLDLTEPLHPMPGRAYLSTDYRALANLATHIDELDEDVALKQAVLATFFLRFLKFAGYFGNSGSNASLKGQRSLGTTETFLLRLIHQIINVQAFNSHSVHTVSSTASFDWERIATSINPSLALVNHSCDANTIRANVNKSSILVAARHIPQGQEITDSYTVHFRNSPLHDRQYHTLKYYQFACECEACSNNWPLEDDIPDELPRIPNFDQETIYVKRHGDKKELVSEIVDERRAVEECMTRKSYAEALLAYAELCHKLELHVRKPHAYFLQARAGISHCIWNLHCRQEAVNADEEAVEDVTGRDRAKNIYKSTFVEKFEDNTALELGENAEDNLNPEPLINKEKLELIENIKSSLHSSAQRLTALKEEQEAYKKIENEMENIDKNEKNYIKNTENKEKVVEKEEIAQISRIPKRELSPVSEKLKVEMDELKRIDEEIRERKRKEWEQKEKQRLEEQEEKRRKKEKAIEEKLQRKKEEERIKKEQKLKEEELRRQQKEEMFSKKQEQERILNEQLRIERENKKKQEEAELEELLTALESDHAESEVVEELCKEDAQATDSLDARNDPEDGSKDDCKMGSLMDDSKNWASDDEQVEKVNSESVPVKDILQDRVFDESPAPQKYVSANKKDDDKPMVENVWSALRKLKQSAIPVQSNMNHIENAPVMTPIDLENLISSVSEKMANVKKKNKQSTANDIHKDMIPEEGVVSLEEENQQDMETARSHQCQQKPPPIPFDYDSWKAEINKYFNSSEDEESNALELEKSYMEDLKKKIDDKIRKELQTMQKSEVKKIPVKDLATNPSIAKASASKQDEFANLKMKEKDRKRKKKEEKLKDTEEKVKDMAQKTLKMERISVNTENELKQMKERAKAMVLKSRMKEQEFHDIFKAIGEEEILLKKNKTRAETLLKSNEDPHWTEDESNKWPQQTAPAGVTNVLSLLKVAAQGKSGLSETVKETIQNCKTISIHKDTNRGEQKLTSIPWNTKHLTPHSTVDLPKIQEIAQSSKPNKSSVLQKSAEYREDDQLKLDNSCKEFKDCVSILNSFTPISLPKLSTDAVSNIGICDEKVSKIVKTASEEADHEKTAISNVSSQRQVKEDQVKKDNVLVESPIRISNNNEVDGSEAMTDDRKMKEVEKTAIQHKESVRSNKFSSFQIKESSKTTSSMRDSSRLPTNSNDKKHKPLIKKLSVQDEVFENKKLPGLQEKQDTEENIPNEKFQIQQNHKSNKDNITEKGNLGNKRSNNQEHITIAEELQEKTNLHEINSIDELKQKEICHNNNVTITTSNSEIQSTNKIPSQPYKLGSSSCEQTNQKVGESALVVERNEGSKETTIDQIESLNNRSQSKKSVNIEPELAKKEKDGIGEESNMNNYNKESAHRHTVKSTCSTDSEVAVSKISAKQVVQKKETTKDKTLSRPVKLVQYPVVIHVVTPTSFLPKNVEKSQIPPSPATARKSLSSLVQSYNVECLPTEVTTLKISHPQGLKSSTGGIAELKMSEKSLVCNNGELELTSPIRREEPSRSYSNSKGLKEKSARPPPPKFKPPPPPPIFF